MLGSDKKLSDYMSFPEIKPNTVSNDQTFQIRKEMILYFIVFDLVLLLIASWAWNYKGDKNVLDQLSLISSISSILLALVAIGYAFMQSNDSSRQNSQVQTGLTKINEKLSEVSIIKDQVERVQTTLERNQSGTEIYKIIQSVLGGKNIDLESKKQLETVLHLSQTLTESSQKASPIVTNNIYQSVAEQSPNNVFSYAVVIGKTGSNDIEDVFRKLSNDSIQLYSFEKLSETEDGISYKINVLRTSSFLISLLIPNTLSEVLKSKGLDVWSVVQI